MGRDRRDLLKFAISTPPMRYMVCECVPEKDQNRVPAVHKEDILRMLSRNRSLSQLRCSCSHRRSLTLTDFLRLFSFVLKSLMEEKLGYFRIE